MKELKKKLFMSLAKAKRWVQSNREEGCICPCCEQTAKLYKRKLNSSMAYGLIELYKQDSINPKKLFFHTTELKTNGGGDFAQLKHWGLTSEKPKDVDDKVKRTSGFWAITKKGREFVESVIEVESHVFLYNAELLGYAETKTDIATALGNKFNYSELMNEVVETSNIK